MVGALRDDKITAFGTDSAAEWRGLVSVVAAVCDHATACVIGPVDERDAFGRG
jgi:sulfur transfer protein SufE